MYYMHIVKTSNMRESLNRVGESTRLSNRIGRDSGSTSGRPVAQLGVRLCNRHPVTQPGGLRIRAEHIYPLTSLKIAITLLLTN